MTDGGRVPTAHVKYPGIVQRTPHRKIKEYGYRVPIERSIGSDFYAATGAPEGSDIIRARKLERRVA